MAPLSDSHDLLSAIWFRDSGKSKINSPRDSTGEVPVIAPATKDCDFRNEWLIGTAHQLGRELHLREILQNY
jgi:hypothetical protein